MLRYLAICLAAGAVVAEPALAQYDYDRPSRTGRVADEIARTVEETARAMGTVRDSFDRGLYDVRFRGPERYAVDACRHQVERYGRMRVDEVRPYKRHGFRVYGITEGFGGDYRGYSRYNNPPRSFTCTVRDDGRVKVKTKRLRRY